MNHVRNVTKGLFLTAATGQEQEIVCGAEWVTFPLPGVSESERKDVGLPMATAPKETVLTPRKRDLRNLVFSPDTRGGEIVFGLDTAHPERKRVMYSSLVTEAVYVGVLACLN